MWIGFGLFLAVSFQVNLQTAARKRFEIPTPGDEDPLIPEKISVILKRGSIVDTELPGGYGEDLVLQNLENPDSIEDSENEKENEINENHAVQVKKSVVNSPGSDLAGKFGNNVVPPVRTIPTAISVNHGNQASQNHIKKGRRRHRRRHKYKFAKEGKGVISSGKKTTKHKRRRKYKSTKDGKDMLSKINKIAMEIEKIQHKEKIDRKEEARLEAEKKVMMSIEKKHEKKDIPHGDKEVGKRSKIVTPFRNIGKKRRRSRKVGRQNKKFKASGRHNGSYRKEKRVKKSR